MEDGFAKKRENAKPIMHAFCIRMISSNTEKKDHNSLDAKRVLDWGGLRLLLWETFHTWSFSNSKDKLEQVHLYFDFRRAIGHTES